MENERSNLEKLLDFVYEYDYKLTNTGNSITQKQRNELKYNLTQEVVAVLLNNGIPYITQTADGFILEIQHEDLGVIPVELNLKVKNLDYDISAAEDEWLMKVEQRRLKEQKKK
jgi:hypothetical protein